MNRIKKGDTVKVISGDDRGKTGEVLRVFPKANRIVVSGVNIIVKHQRAIRAGRSQMQGGRVELEAPIHVSNVMLVCPHCKEATRVGFSLLEDGRKVRMCKKCGASID